MEPSLSLDEPLEVAQLRAAAAGLAATLPARAPGNHLHPAQRVEIGRLFAGLSTFLGAAGAEAVLMRELTASRKTVQECAALFAGGCSRPRRVLRRGTRLLLGMLAGLPPSSPGASLCRAGAAGAVISPGSAGSGGDTFDATHPLRRHEDSPVGIWGAVARGGGA